MHLYQKTATYFAQLAEGLQELACTELEELGARNIRPVYRGIYFQGEQAVLYRVNYCARLISRVLAPLIVFNCHSDRYLYKTATGLPWEEFLTVKDSLAVFATVSHSRIRHSRFAALRLKDAIVDRFREREGARPAVDREHPRVRVHLHLHNNKAVISLDTSGDSLHRRGYRNTGLEAPLQETVAAAMVRLCGWQGCRPLLDPCCGSGTLLAEAWMAGCHIPAAHLRSWFGFMALPEYDQGVWKQVKHAADERIRLLDAGLVRGSDVDPQAVAAARDNLSRLPGAERIRLQCSDFRDLPPFSSGVLLANPPHGIRLGSTEAAAQLYRELGDWLKARCPESEAYVYYGDKTLVRELRLKADWKKPLASGGLDGRLVKYRLYGGGEG